MSISNSIMLSAMAREPFQRTPKPASVTRHSSSQRRHHTQQPESCPLHPRTQGYHPLASRSETQRSIVVRVLTWLRLALTARLPAPNPASWPHANNMTRRHEKVGVYKEENKCPQVAEGIQEHAVAVQASGMGEDAGQTGQDRADYADRVHCQATPEDPARRTPDTLVRQCAAAAEESTSASAPSGASAASTYLVDTCLPSSFSSLSFAMSCRASSSLPEPPPSRTTVANPVRTAHDASLAPFSHFEPPRHARSKRPPRTEGTAATTPRRPRSLPVLETLIEVVEAADINLPAPGETCAWSGSKPRRMAETTPRKSARDVLELDEFGSFEYDSDFPQLYDTPRPRRRAGVFFLTLPDVIEEPAEDDGDTDTDEDTPLTPPCCWPQSGSIVTPCDEELDYFSPHECSAQLAEGASLGAVMSVSAKPELGMAGCRSPALVLAWGRRGSV